MTHFVLDMRSAIFMVFLGNLIALLMFSAYRNIEGLAKSYRVFIAAKGLQTMAWGLLSMRGYAPDWLSAYLGNYISYAGFALELGMIVFHGTRNRQACWALALVAFAGALGYGMWGDSPGMRVLLASLTVSALFVMAGVFMSFNQLHSMVYRLMMWFYLFLGGVMLSRAVLGLLFGVSGDTVGLLNPNLGQSVFILSFFAFMLVGGIGFLLVLKEQSDRQLNLSHHALTVSESLLKGVLDTSSVSVFMGDAQGVVVLANKRMAEMFAVQFESLKGANYFNFIHPDEQLEARQRIAALVSGEVASVEIERLYVKGDGATFWGQLTARVMQSEPGATLQLVLVVVDISERKQAEACIREMAHYDMLTGLANRNLLSERIKCTLATARREQSKFALLYLDLNKFKQVNDQMGHQCGDQLLQQAASRINATVRESDLVARVGGDEFMVLLPQTGSVEDALLVAQKIQEALEQAFWIENQAVFISCSAGIAVYPDHGEDERQLIKVADTAMYSAKRGNQDVDI
jgi:diguanylate cyclase (GGDEF)-like protein/PAS domain S-box-containing protein